MTEQIFDSVDDAKALVIFAHGAGADMEHQYISHLAKALNMQQLNVLRFNFPYMDKRKLDGKRRPPDRMPKLLSCYEQLLTDIESPLPIFIAGKSMGGRVAATLASTCGKQAKGVICLGYPFHPIKQPEKLRLEPLQDTQLPILILQGERDALGSKADIAKYTISNLCELVYFADGDHDLKPRIKSGFTHQQHIDKAVAQIKRFIDEQC
jgi:predicted alpha/beta-hydrolase family hydrolase